MTYLFETTTTMKEYNNKKWWIDGNIIPAMRIAADNLKTALEEYRQRALDDSCITISDNALKTKNPMYIDTQDGTKQVGYVITGCTDFQTDYGKWSKQYIDLWINISIIDSPDFKTGV